MQSGTICLKDLYDLACKYPSGDAMHGNGPSGREYGKAVVKLAQVIAESQGFYIWGKYESNLLWRTLYVGKAGLGKTASLRARITEELKDERAFVWCGKHTGKDEPSVKAIWQKYFPPVSNAAENHINRALKKQGTTHIVWVATPRIIDNSDVKVIEADLIETLSPLVNGQRKPPIPIPNLHDVTADIIKQFKHEIHFHRP